MTMTMNENSEVRTPATDAETEAHMPLRKGPSATVSDGDDNEAEAHMPIKRGSPSTTVSDGDDTETEGHVGRFKG